ncbi:Replication protein P [Serratia proteamaculans]|nr:Replication protein P [Serratia proteamaculans]
MEAFGSELTRVLLQEAINPEQLNYAIRTAPGRKFYPFPAPPDWLAMAKKLIDARLPTVDVVMEEFDRYSARRGGFACPEEFRWKAPILYWIVTDLRKAMLQYNHGVAELRKVAEKLLRQWEKRLQEGERIPEPVIRLGHTEIPIGVGKERGLTTPETEKKGMALLQSIRLKVAQAKTSKD